MFLDFARPEADITSMTEEISNQEWAFIQVFRLDPSGQVEGFSRAVGAPRRAG
jgi:hypothetical protein